MKIVTWNIAGGKKVKSLEQWDYEKENLTYFIEKLQEYSPDVIALQEVLLKPNYNQTEQIAKSLGYKYFTQVEMSPDHIEKDTQICISLISREPLEDIKRTLLPYPSFKCVFKNGVEAKKYDKYILSAVVRGIHVATLQMQPLHLWGYTYYDNKGYEYAQEIDTQLAGLKEPLILLGDLQHNDPEKYLPKFYETHKKEALPKGSITRPRKEGNSTMSDHIVVSKNIKVIETVIDKTLTDHYLCFADLSEF